MRDLGPDRTMPPTARNCHVGVHVATHSQDYPRLFNTGIRIGYKNCFTNAMMMGFWGFEQGGPLQPCVSHDEPKLCPPPPTQPCSLPPSPYAPT